MPRADRRFQRREYCSEACVAESRRVFGPDQMTRRRFDRRPRGAILATALLLGAWVLTGPGRLAAAALLEHEHSVELTVADGHIDLRLGHSASAHRGHRHDDSTPTHHVVHLCMSTDLLVPRAPADLPPLPGLVGSLPSARTFAFASSALVAAAPGLSALHAPARFVPLLL